MDTFLSHLAEKRAKLQKQLKRLENDLGDLDKAERLYRESGAAAAMAADDDEIPQQVQDLLGPPAGYYQVAAPTEGTIKQRVMAILDKNPGGLTSGQILNNLRISGLPNLMRESLSPQLSRLKKEQEIALDSTTSLWKRVNKHESHAG